ncbi:MAG: FkbM family methyltransferase [Patescibacteria group bacterium]
MIKKLLFKFLNLICLVTKKTVIYYNKNKYNSLGKTAVKSELGFWYVGNIFDQSDIAYGIANNGFVEPEETDIVKQILETNLVKSEKQVFYDIGANTGYYGIVAAWLGRGNIKVHSFEPLVEHISCLNESVRLNRLDDSLTSHLIALSDINKTDIIFTAGSGTSFDENFLGDINAPKREVQLCKLDDLVLEEKIPQPDFIKIDVEGHEFKVLNGAFKVISTGLPVVFMEVAYSLKNIGRKFINQNYEETFKYFEVLGYSTFIVDGPCLREYKCEEHIDGVRMFLFIHSVKHVDLFDKLKFCSSDNN